MPLLGVNSELSRPRKTGITNCTNEAFFSSMCFDMVFTRTRRAKSFRTEITFEWTFAGMDANVCDHVMFESHSFLRLTIMVTSKP